MKVEEVEMEMEMEMEMWEREGGWAMGVVRLRLARFGRKNLPFYRIFVADSRAPRDGKHIEVVGHYNPLPGECLSRLHASCSSGFGKDNWVNFWSVWSCLFLRVDVLQAFSSFLSLRDS